MLKLENVSFAYGDNPVLENLSFELKKGENLSVIGESGCGKSTLLKLIYGLLPSKGRIFWGEEELLGPDFNLVPGEPFIKYLAQDFDLMLPLTVAENVGKHLSNMYPRKKKQRVKELLEVVEMSELSQKKAKLLSGGQQQRVALARALGREPKLLLLDEPFSHIDHFRKNNLRRRLFAYLKERDISCIVATHDITDALSFADRTMVLRDTKVLAYQTPEELYLRPPNSYVASLFGDVNELRVKDLRPETNSRKKLLIYPHELRPGKDQGIKVQVMKTYFMGKIYLIKAVHGKKNIFFEHQGPLEQGTTLFLDVKDNLIALRG